MLSLFVQLELPGFDLMTSWSRDRNTVPEPPPIPPLNTTTKSPRLVRSPARWMWGWWTAAAVARSAVVTVASSNFLRGLSFEATGSAWSTAKKRRYSYTLKYIYTL